MQSLKFFKKNLQIYKVRKSLNSMLQYFKPNSKFMEKRTTQDKSCQRWQTSFHANRRKYERTFKYDFKFYLLLLVNFIEPSISEHFNVFSVFIQGCQSMSYIRLYVSVLIIGWRQILFLHSVNYIRLWDGQGTGQHVLIMSHRPRRYVSHVGDVSEIN